MDIRVHLEQSHVKNIPLNTSLRAGFADAWVWHRGGEAIPALGQGEIAAICDCFGVKTTPCKDIPKPYTIALCPNFFSSKFGYNTGLMTYLVPLLAIFLILVFGYSVMSALWTSAHGAPWVPTKLRTVRRMLEMAQVRPGETVYDLGSGDGRVLIVAAREFGAHAVGIELDPLRVLWTRGWVLLLGLRKTVKVRTGNFFHQDLSQADVVVCYLLTSTNQRLTDKLTQELRPGTRVVSNAFPFPEWDIVKEDLDNRVYLYRING